MAIEVADDIIDQGRLDELQALFVTGKELGDFVDPKICSELTVEELHYLILAFRLYLMSKD